MLRFLGLCLLASVALCTGAAAQQTTCKSIRALDGTCADAALVDINSRRSAVISSARTSYSGSPIGTVGQGPIPYERLFQDDPAVYGLPTYKTTIGFSTVFDFGGGGGGVSVTVTGTNRTK